MSGLCLRELNKEKDELIFAIAMSGLCNDRVNICCGLCDDEVNRTNVTVIIACLSLRLVHVS